MLSTPPAPKEPILLELVTIYLKYKQIVASTPHLDKVSYSIITLRALSKGSAQLTHKNPWWNSEFHFCFVWVVGSKYKRMRSKCSLISSTMGLGPRLRYEPISSQTCILFNEVVFSLLSATFQIDSNLVKTTVVWDPNSSLRLQYRVLENIFKDIKH